MGLLSAIESIQDADAAIFCISGFLKYQSSQVNVELSKMTGGTIRTRRSEREADRIKRLRLLFISGTISTVATVALQRTRAGVHVDVAQDYHGDSDAADLSRYHQLQEDASGFMLKYGASSITPSMHAAYVQHIVQTMYGNKHPLAEDRNALTQYVYGFCIDRIWNRLHAGLEGLDNPFIELLLTWRSGPTLTESEFRCRSRVTGSLPKDLEREDESRLSEYISGLATCKSNGKPAQYDLTDEQAWHLFAKFQSCLSRIRSSARMIKDCVGSRPNPEPRSVTGLSRQLLSGSVKFLAFSLQILGWLVHHSPSFWKLLESLKPVLLERMENISQMDRINREFLINNDPKLTSSSSRDHNRTDYKDKEALIGADSIRGWLKELTDYHQLLHELCAGPEANGVIGGQVEISVDIVSQMPRLETLSPRGRTLRMLHGGSQHSVSADTYCFRNWLSETGQESLHSEDPHCEAYLASLVMTGKVPRGSTLSANGCCFCCSRLVQLAHIKSVPPVSQNLAIRPWIPPEGVPIESRLQILDDLLEILSSEGS